MKVKPGIVVWGIVPLPYQEREGNRKQKGNKLSISSKKLKKYGECPRQRVLGTLFSLL
jgi:hypothetical protein